MMHKRAEASAKACNCTVESSVYECPYGETILNEPLAKMLEEEFKAIGRDKLIL